jgi:hypothetical protein
LNPMVGGTGLKIKTVEPLSYGKPVLTTLPGAQGLTHLWQLPMFDDNAGLTDYLFASFGRDSTAVLTQLAAQAASTRRALDSEYEGQVDRLARWLAAKV